MVLGKVNAIGIRGYLKNFLIYFWLPWIFLAVHLFQIWYNVIDTYSFSSLSGILEMMSEFRQMQNYMFQGSFSIISHIYLFMM